MGSLHLNFPRQAFLSVTVFLFLLISCGSLFSEETSFDETKTKAEAGDAEAQNNLGKMYNEGSGVNKDINQARDWFKKSAEQGNVNGEVSLGKWYLAKDKKDNGDYNEILKWFRKAAEQGCAEAQIQLGTMSHDGVGTGRDIAAAIKWYRKAADQGNTDALERLGHMYDDGDGVPANGQEAAKYYRLAVYAGSTGCQKLMGDLYAKGGGILKRDPVEALAWYYLSNETDQYSASTGSLENELSQKGVLAAKKRAQALRAEIDSKQKPGK